MRYLDIEDFDEAKSRKWKESRKARGLSENGPFTRTDDPFEEAYQEYLDIYSYCEEIEKRHPNISLHALKQSAKSNSYALRKFSGQVQRSVESVSTAV